MALATSPVGRAFSTPQPSESGGEPSADRTYFNPGWWKYNKLDAAKAVEGKKIERRLGNVRGDVSDERTKLAAPSKVPPQQAGNNQFKKLAKDVGNLPSKPSAEGERRGQLREQLERYQAQLDQQSQQDRKAPGFDGGRSVASSESLRRTCW